jgi:predicted Zn-dependent protease
MELRHRQELDGSLAYHITMIPRVLIAAALFAVPVALAQGLPDLGEPAQAALSPVQERLLGQSIMRQARRDPDFFDDPEVTDYIARVGARLAAKGLDTRQTFEFFLMRDREINAFALPGGFIGVHTGLIMAAQSESEMAGVVAHEIAHVTQRHIARMMSNDTSSHWFTLASLAVAILAARSNSQLAQGLATAGPALAVQRQLDFSRDFEREADRVGFQMLEKAGFDHQGMSGFFERLQRATRVYEGGAPAYLRTHPLNHERIADMQSRSAGLPYRQVPDSVEFHLVRARLKSELEPPRETVAHYRDLVASQRYQSEAGAYYGWANALLRYADVAGARKSHARLVKLLPAHPMVDLLGCRIKLAGGEADAQQCYQAALKAYPDQRAIVYEYAEVLLRFRDPTEALRVVEARLATERSDHRLRQFQSRAYAALNRRLAHHRAQAEVYWLIGSTTAAVEQLQLGLAAGDGDYYQMSAAEARLRELRRQDAEERKDAGRSAKK